LKLNFVGIIGGILAFVSLALPWWTLTLSAAGYSVDVSVYPYRVLAAGVTINMDVWYGWAALALVVIGGILGILGGVMEYGKKLLVGGGVLALLSVIVFAVGLQMELPELFTVGITGVGLFSSGSFTMYETLINYLSYLSFGFWLALVGAVIMLVASRKRPVEAVPPPPPQPPT